MINWLKTHGQFNQVFIYSPIFSEPSVLSIIHQNKYTFGLPRIVTESSVSNILFMKFDKTTILELNQYNILEPKSSEILNPTKQTLVLTPCLGCNEKGFRLGYGGGYYDRFFKKNHFVTKMAIMFEQSFVVDIPYDSEDVPMDYIATQHRILHIK